MKTRITELFGIEHPISRLPRFAAWQGSLTGLNCEVRRDEVVQWEPDAASLLRQLSRMGAGLPHARMNPRGGSGEEISRSRFERSVGVEIACQSLQLGLPADHGTRQPRDAAMPEARRSRGDHVEDDHRPRALGGQGQPQLILTPGRGEATKKHQTFLD